MDKNRLKKFAIESRKDLMKKIEDKINYKKIDYIYLLCFVIIFNPLQIVVHDFCINIILVKLFALIFLLALILQNFINIYRNRKNINNNS